MLGWDGPKSINKQPNDLYCTLILVSTQLIVYIHMPFCINRLENHQRSEMMITE
jgi:uncharacterized protein VirK/YbjX